MRLANNPYWRSYLVDRSTCIVFDKIKAYNLPDLLSLISTKQLKNISLNARILSSGLFKLRSLNRYMGFPKLIDLILCILRLSIYSVKACQ